MGYEALAAIIRHVKPHSHMCESRNQLVLSLKNQNPTFSPRMRGKTRILRGYYRDKGPRSYIGPWVLSENIEKSEEEQIIIMGFNLKSHKEGTNGM